MSTIPKPDPAPSHADDERPAFERAIAIARRNWPILLVSLIVVPIVALAYSLAQTKQYTATATLLFGNSSLNQQLFADLLPTDTDSQREAETNLRLVQLERISERTADALDQPGVTTELVSEEIEVTPQGESDLIAIDATDPSPENAALLANEFAEQYIDFRRETDRKKVAKAQQLVETRLTEMTPAEREGQEGQEFEQRKRQLALISTLETGDTELVQEAAVPDSPSSPQTKRNVALGILLGAVLGICLALLREQLDRRLRDPEDVADLFGVPILATIPESAMISGAELGRALAPSGVEDEAFRMLRASLRYFNVERDVTTVLVTSAVSQDGKTTVAWNLALAEARSDSRTLYIEADLRRPSLLSAAATSATEGLGQMLASGDDASRAITTVQGVDVLPAGPPPPNPAELIESERMSELLAWAAGHYDRVIIDTPPAAVVADPVALYNQVDGVVIVTRLRKSPRDAVEHLRDQLANTSAPILGVVINGVRTPADSSYYRVPSKASSNGNHSAVSRSKRHRGDALSSRRNP
ncbi:MAG: polysaccharide biosynthesis tyrosine autokinase [Solirubrobacterales bacterium]